MAHSNWHPLSVLRLQNGVTFINPRQTSEEGTKGVLVHITCLEMPVKVEDIDYLHKHAHSSTHIWGAGLTDLHVTSTIIGDFWLKI